MLCYAMDVEADGPSRGWLMVIDDEPAQRRLVAAIQAKGGVAIVTADHGNCERMLDLITGEPHTYHTTQPVNLFVLGDG